MWQHDQGATCWRSAGAGVTQAKREWLTERQSGKQDIKIIPEYMLSILCGRPHSHIVFYNCTPCEGAAWGGRVGASSPVELHVCLHGFRWWPAGLPRGTLPLLWDPRCRQRGKELAIKHNTVCASREAGCCGEQAAGGYALRPRAAIHRGHCGAYSRGSCSPRR